MRTWPATHFIKVSCWISIFFTIFLVSGRVAQATDSYSIKATVRLSVCGDGVVENPEQCEGGDLTNKTCMDLGFAQGTLKCDIACDFDTTDCSGTAPTPTPSPTTTDSTTKSTEVKADEKNKSQLTETATTPTPTPSATIESVTTPLTNFGFPTVVRQETIRELLNLPVSLLSFDTNADGVIDKQELTPTVTNWVTEWKNFRATVSGGSVASPPACDINGDVECDLVDFSLLMYYVERE